MSIKCARRTIFRWIISRNEPFNNSFKFCARQCLFCLFSVLFRSPCACVCASLQMFSLTKCDHKHPTNSMDEFFDDRMEPQCITCDIDSLLWSSRRLYTNCSYFDVYLSPSSSIATDYRVEHYVLDCQGPTLPVAGNHFLLSSIFLRFFLITSTIKL